MGKVVFECRRCGHKEILDERLAMKWFDYEQLNGLAPAICPKCFADMWLVKPK